MTANAALLLEAEILHPEYARTVADKHAPGPLRDSGTIRVYHGFNDINDAVDACAHGISGKARANRRYSYEANNNPWGLFVTAVLDVAKDFVGSYSDAAIIEFHARVSDLEAPVWPGGGYTVQGQMAQYFDNSSSKALRADRDKARLRDRESAQKFADERPWAAHVGKSDRAELARSLYISGEHQALFTGDLNPNMIRAVWVCKKDEKSGYLLSGRPYTRMSRKDFLRNYHNPDRKRNQYADDPSGRLYKPAEDWTGKDDFIARLVRMNGGTDEFYRNAMEGMSPDTIVRSLKSYLWPKQVEMLKAELGIE